MRVLIRLESLVGPGDFFARSCEGHYVGEYDPKLLVLWTHADIAKARVFPSMSKAWEYWKQEDGVRADGKPNRPLTAYTISILPAPPMKVLKEGEAEP